MMKKNVLLLLNVFVFCGAFAQYPSIRISDVVVTPDNQGSITSNYITGSVSYDSASRTLVLQNATINCSNSSDPYDDNNGKTVSIEAHSGQVVNIELIGQNTIFGPFPLVLHNGAYNVTGSGSLILEGLIAGVFCEPGVDAFRVMQWAQVVIDIPYASSIGFRGSPQYQGYDMTVLSVNSGTLIVEADYCIESIVGFQLVGSHLVQPEDAYFDTEGRTLVTENGPVRDYLEIRPGAVGIDEDRGVSFRAWGCDGGLHVEGAQESSPVEIVNVLGRVVYQSLLNGAKAYIPMQKGFYIVRVNNHSKKIIVK
jgi:hypothetical protein